MFYIKNNELLGSVDNVRPTRGNRPRLFVFRGMPEVKLYFEFNSVTLALVVCLRLISYEEHKIIASRWWACPLALHYIVEQKIRRTIKTMLTSP